MTDASNDATVRSTVGGFDGVSEAERVALHEVELGVERLHRAHGSLVAFHHHTGGAMDHLAAAERLLRDGGYGALADQLRDDYLPRGVITDVDVVDPTAGRWSYDVLENFQETFLHDLVAFGDEVHATVAGGVRHVFERQQEREWKDRSRHG